MPRRLPVLLVLALVLVTVPVGVGAAASPTLRLAIRHVVSGCHVWVTGGTVRGPSAKIVIQRGTRVELRPSCPMDFDVVQLRGPALRLGPPRVHAGQTRFITFTRRGSYTLRAKNVQSSAQLGLQTLGPDNTLMLTVVVR